MGTINFKIEKFLGLNESPDGDSGLKMGEAAAMTNFRVTEEGNLKKMCGYGLYSAAGQAAPIDGMAWWGDLLIYAAGGLLYTCDGETTSELPFAEMVSLTPGRASLFVFSDKLYIINGQEYLYWAGEGSAVKNVTGYVPVVLIASDPASGAGTEYEAVNQLTPKRRQRFNGDNAAVAYKMGEPEIDSIDRVTVNGQDRRLTTDYTVAVTDGYTTVNFGTAPTEGLDNVEIQYSKSKVTNTDRFTSLAHAVSYHLSGREIDSITSVTVNGVPVTAYTPDLEEGAITFDTAPSAGKPVVVQWSKTLTPKVKDMKYVQFFGGENNTRVFVYGDGSHTVYYSEPEEGATKPSAEYFPELNRMDVDLDSVAVTALLPYYDRLFIFKEDSIFYCRYAALKGEEGSVIVSFPTTNLTKSVGCAAYQGALNIPAGIVFPAQDGIYLASGGAVYEQMSERLISKKVGSSYNGFNKGEMLVINNAGAGECWFADGREALVYNYRNGTWYKLALGEAVRAVLYREGQVYFGDGGGRIFLFGDDRLSFNGGSIAAYWESGSMDFGHFDKKKWLDRVWLILKSEANSRLTFDLESDQSGFYPARQLSQGRATFATADFTNFSFNTNDKPAAKTVRIKAKKFNFLKLILKNDSAADRATVMNITAPVKVGGTSK